MDTRLEKINNLLVNYSLGNFDLKIEPTDQFDEIDAFISNINMLGEELQSSTITKNYFNNIFNSVSDMLFVLNNDGIINSVNKAAASKLKCTEKQLTGNSVDFLVGEVHNFFCMIKSYFTKSTQTVDLESKFYSIEGEIIPVSCSCSYLFDKEHKKIGYLLIARDQSKIKRVERSLKESHEKYKKIFNESSDAIYVIDVHGKFIDLNQAGVILFECERESLAKLSFFDFMYDEDKRELFQNKLKTRGTVIDFGIKMKNYYENIIDCLISAHKIVNENETIIGYQGIIKDISLQKEMENVVIRTIVDTQEKERKRIVEDLHDSLGQKLSGIKFYLGTVKSMNNNLFGSTQKATLIKSNNALDGVLNALDDMIDELSSICFNLMPGTLQNFGLKYAIIELCKKMQLTSTIEFNISIEADFPEFDKMLEVSIFRIIQEFINNSIKHSGAKKIYIQINAFFKKGNIFMLLEDDGKGFLLKRVEKYSGMGLKNITSRVKSYNGDLKIFSILNLGTKFEITIPYQQYIIHEKNKNFNN